jgi:hypothetical protein
MVHENKLIAWVTVKNVVSYYVKNHVELKFN